MVRRSMKQHATALFVLLALGAGVLTTTSPAGAELAPAAAGTSRAQADYALDNFGDPWDFSNPEDFELAPGVQTEGVLGLSMSGGQLHGTAGAFGKFEFLRSWQGMGLPWGRDPVLHPVDTNRYRVLSFSMTADHDGNGFVLWYTCAQILSTCQGGFPFATKAGTHTYTFDIPTQTPDPGSPQPWAGPILGLHVVPSASSAITVSFDWVRLTPAGADPAPADPPQPRFLVPSRSGGRDYASAVRGDAWDFSQPSDVADSAGLNFTVSGGVLDGTNTGGGDPEIVLPLGPVPVDGTRWHRLVFGISYDGPFGLSGAPGGGMVARLIWQIDGHPEFFQDSQDIIVYPGFHVYDVDLATNPPADANDESDNPRIGWVNQQLSYVRFDPNEDPGARHFVLDWVRLAEDNDSSTPIQFFDAAWTAGETVDLFASSDPNSCNGSVIATGVPVANGINSVAWPAGFPAGLYWVCGRFRNGTYESPLIGAAPVRVLPTSRPPGYTTACDGASQQPTAFADAGLAADCLKLYGVALGKSDGTFGENDPLLRSQVSSLLARLVQLAGVSLSARHPFPDVNPDSVPNAQVRDEIELLAGSGIITGFSDGTFGPTLHLSVAQAATLVVRTLGFIHANKPAAWPIADQGNTTTNYLFGLLEGIVDPAATDVNATRYPSQPGDGTARGSLADMLAQSIELLVDTGVVANRATP